MNKQLLKLITNKELLNGHIGIEREGLRVDKNGILSFSKHPEVFGDKILNPYITTDFSESQIELITPVFNTSEEAYDFLTNLYNIVDLELGDGEFIWPQSMPCIIPNNKSIPIAIYDDYTLEGDTSRKYREKLMDKYGAEKQLISGIHYNFSFNEELLNLLYEHSDKTVNYKTFRDNTYLKVARNFLRYRWIISYLLGSTGVVHESFTANCVSKLNQITEGAFSNKGATSYRNSECGYRNKVELYPDYSSTSCYINSIKKYINSGLIESPKELYSSIRIKAKNNHNLFESLENDGINYLEFRSIDINPFDKCGIGLSDLHFLHLFNFFLLFKEEQKYDNWQQEANDNQDLIARYGHSDIELHRNGLSINKKEWAMEILSEVLDLNEALKFGKEEIVHSMIEKVKDYKLTNSYQITAKVKEEGFVDAHLKLAKQYKKNAYENRFRLIGYEDMELSTQILMKDAIKRGIRVDVIDKKENFISLKKNNVIEYVKQATKTSKDNYVSVLIMENKLVTKKVLENKGIRVPSGMEFYSLEDSMNSIEKLSDTPSVIKPKSTNFGLGISIFSSGAKKEDLEEAFKIAFKYDHTVLVEEFIPGKEYRFLVIGDKVAGILHRVPANVVGDGVRTISELVAEKNKNPLRGKGYRTPLEKINLDDNVELFLKQSKRDINYIPDKGEIVFLRENSNISTGGDSVDFTDIIPNRFKKIAVEASKAVGAKICGVDMMIEDYTNEKSSYGIIELNFNPAIHIHSYPYKGEEREIAKEILELLQLA